MAGGRGERFWPESRIARPKQLLPIVGEKAMLAQTIERLAGLVPPRDIFIITNIEQREAVLEVCPELDPAKVIGEPIGRDTAAAVGLATILVTREDPEASFAMLPADAVIHDAEGLCATLESAFAVAEAQPVLATIGITASFPATGYGYIQQGDTMGEYAGREVYQVKRFVEKPDQATAEAYLERAPSLEATARELFVHPNTVRYRLSRIAETTGFSATDPRGALALRLALILGRIQTGIQAGTEDPNL